MKHEQINQETKDENKYSRTHVTIVLILIASILVMPIIHAQDLTFSLNQSDYYFFTGEDAIVPLTAANTYAATISGTLSYTLTQSVNQGNFQMSNSNTKSTSFNVPIGTNEMTLDFGTSDSPIQIKASLTFNYDQNGSRQVNIDNLIIHFIQNSSQQNNQQSQQNSQSKQQGIQSSSQPANQNQQQDPFAQQEQRMQQMINQAAQNQEQNQPQPSSQSQQNALQNNQMAQDSTAIKQQMQQQAAQQQAEQQAFAKELSKNLEFEQENQKLQQQGFNITNTDINPDSNDTGSFNIHYQDKNGQQASLQGNLQNGTLQNFQKDTPQTRQNIMNALQNNSQYQKYNQQLQNQGYKPTQMQISTDNNTTTVQLNYSNQKNQTAQITAEFQNATVQKVELVNENAFDTTMYYIVFILILVFLLLGYFLYKKFTKKKPVEDTANTIVPEKLFDYRGEARKLIKEAQESFDSKEYKDAYGKAASAVRLFLSYENGLNKEITNDDIIKYLFRYKKPYKEIKECFDLCSLVEFAKYEANNKDFEKIIKLGYEIVGSKK